MGQSKPERGEKREGCKGAGRSASRRGGEGLTGCQNTPLSRRVAYKFCFVRIKTAL